MVLCPRPALFPPPGKLGRRRHRISRRRGADRDALHALCRSARTKPMSRPADEAGHPRDGDYNGAEQHGFGRTQATIRNGRRASAAGGLSAPRARAPESPASRPRRWSRASSSKAIAPSASNMRRTGRPPIAARRRARCCSAGGVINSPQVLMLSGIGDPDELARHGIEVKVGLKGVGKNLQDHLSVGVDYNRRESGTVPAPRFVWTASPSRWLRPISSAPARRPICRAAAWASSRRDPTRRCPTSRSCSAPRREACGPTGRSSSARSPTISARAPYCFARKAAARSSSFPATHAPRCTSTRIFSAPKPIAR